VEHSHSVLQFRLGVAIGIPLIAARFL